MRTLRHRAAHLAEWRKGAGNACGLISRVGGSAACPAAATAASAAIISCSTLIERRIALSPRVFPSATEDNYLKLKELYDLELTVGVARDYLDAAIAHPQDTIAAGWSISCLPSSASNQRLFTVNVGAVEGAYMWATVERRVVTGYFVTIFVDRRTLETESGCSLAELDHRFGGDVYFKEARHAKFKGRAVSLSTEVVGAGIELPDDLPWQRAAAVLADQLTAESTCNYANYHNRWLAECALTSAN